MSSQSSRKFESQKDLPYEWKQTLADVTISIELPQGTRAKFLDVDISKDSLRAFWRFKRDEPPLIQGDLFKPVSREASTWTIVDQKELVITLEKLEKNEWWPHVVTSAPKIDVTKLQPENTKLSDLDPETRQMVEKMMNKQKNESAEEARKKQVLQNFKSQHPELDFSKLNRDDQ
ncbi:hypothetical protein TRVA0_015S01002 [Trichomonascus vanleenenianus]|uniref:NudC domain-containing protein n=1 Tax=Trichomonascus vanleenenianus TaxID=2268995 RepID=UPI003EC99C63